MFQDRTCTKRKMNFNLAISRVDCIRSESIVTRSYDCQVLPCATIYIFRKETLWLLLTENNKIFPLHDLFEARAPLE